MVEDDPRDAELVLHALAVVSLANEVEHLCDRAAALNYLCRRGEFSCRITETQW